MPQNIFSAGRDALLQDLARRDAERRLEEDRSTRDRYAAEDRAHRAAQLGLQTRSVVGAERDREMRANAALAAQGAEQENRQRVDSLIRVVTDPGADPKLREQAGLQLDAMGVDPSALNRVLRGEPKPEIQPVYRTNPDGTVTKVGEVPKGTHFTQTDRPTGASGDLDARTKEYVDSIPTMTNPETGQPYDRRGAIDLVRRNIVLMKQAGQALPDLPKIMARLNQLYTAHRDEYEGTTYPGTSIAAGNPVAAALRSFEQRSGAATPAPATDDASLVPIPGLPGAFARRTADGRFVRVK